MSQSERLIGLSKGLQALALFDETRPFLTIQSAAEALDLTRAAARRILLTLADDGYLIQRERNFYPSSQVLALGFNYFTAMGLPGLSQPGLDRLSDRVAESVGINVLEHGVAILVGRAEPRRLIRLDTPVGMGTPAYASASGRVLLSGLPEKDLNAYLERVEIVRWAARTVRDVAELRVAVRRAREQGWSYASDEARDGLSALAVPVRMPQGRVVAAINIFFLMTDLGEDAAAERFLPALKEAAAEIEALLRASAPALHALHMR